MKRLADKKVLRVAGLMSGTSVDGVDVAIVDIGRRLDQVRVVAFATVPFAPAVREMIFHLFDPARAGVDDICHANFALGEVFADALVRTARRSKVKLDSIDLIGSHGQTVYHMPRGRPLGGKLIRSTLQIGEPSVIAQRTGITTVADFRPRDVAAGGQGAPLVPFADFILLSHRGKNRAVQNIGGIANVTYLPAGGTIDDVRAFDTGPGNMIIDRLASRITRGRLKFDAGGKLAAAGKVNAQLLGELMRHPFLRRRPPKSTGREQFGVQLADDLLAACRKCKIPPADLVATATAFTAASIADAYRRFLGRVDEVILCGGGARNPVLVQMLRRELAGPRVRIIDDFGYSADAKEAVAFALLAAATIRGQANNVPAATGAAEPVIMGKIVPGGNFF